MLDKIEITFFHNKPNTILERNTQIIDTSETLICLLTRKIIELSRVVKGHRLVCRLFRKHAFANNKASQPVRDKLSFQVSYNK